MKVILTSSPTGSLDGKYKVEGLDNRNGFVDYLSSIWKVNSRVLMITAFPDNIPASEQMTGFFEEAVKKMNLSVSSFDLLDYRNQETNILDYDVIFLGGGHVPTQNRFFHEIHLRERMKEFNGIVIGISAGSMNSADVVYVQPEEAGEATDPNFKLFVEGLGLTDINVLPHYQMVKDSYIDGLRLFEDVTYSHSYGHRFICIVDGSFIVTNDGESILYGEGYEIKDGQIHQICSLNERVKL